MQSSPHISLHSPWPLTSQVHGSAQEIAEQGLNERDIPRRVSEWLGAVEDSQAGFPRPKKTEGNQSSETQFLPRLEISPENPGGVFCLGDWNRRL